jgi:hypothetical protein
MFNECIIPKQNQKIKETKMENYTRYRLEKAVQDANDNNIAYLKEEFQTLLESNRPYQAKADYIGYSVSSID